MNPDMKRGERAGTRDEQVTPHVMRIFQIKEILSKGKCE